MARVTQPAPLATECRRVAEAIAGHAAAGVVLIFAAMIAARCRPRRSISFVRELLTACPEQVGAWLPAGWRLELEQSGIWLIHRDGGAPYLQVRFKPLRRKPPSAWLSDPDAIAKWHDELYRPL